LRASCGNVDRLIGNTIHGCARRGRWVQEVPRAQTTVSLGGLMWPAGRLRSLLGDDRGELIATDFGNRAKPFLKMASMIALCACARAVYRSLHKQAVCAPQAQAESPPAAIVRCRHGSNSGAKTYAPLAPTSHFSQQRYKQPNRPRPSHP
jgi:hypothetical protein